MTSARAGVAMRIAEGVDGAARGEHTFARFQVTHVVIDRIAQR